MTDPTARALPCLPSTPTGRGFDRAREGAQLPQPDSTVPPSRSGASGTWSARLDLRFALRRGRTALVHKAHHGPLLVQSPFYPGDGACHVYLLHPPGGVVGGDRLTVEIDSEQDTRTLITTPAATKFYRCDTRRAVQRQHLRVGAGAALEWVPQESLLFDGARTESETRIELRPGARFLGWESWCLGRPAAGERFSAGCLTQRLEVRVDGTATLIERLALAGGSPVLDAPWGLGGLAAWSVFLAYPAAASDLARARAVPGAGCGGDRFGATLIGRLLVVRAQASGIRALNRHLRALWAELRPRIVGLEATPPRIWAT